MVAIIIDVLIMFICFIELLFQEQKILAIALKCSV